MEKLIFTAITLLSIYPVKSFTQKIATISIELSPGKNDLDIPVSINLDPITKLPAGSLSLSEISGKKMIPVPFQVKADKERTLHWIVRHENLLTKRTYQLTQSAPAAFNIIEAVTN